MRRTFISMGNKNLHYLYFFTSVYPFILVSIQLHCLNRELISSLHKTKFRLIYFFSYSWCFCLWFLFKGGCFSSFLTLPIMCKSICTLNLQNIGSLSVNDLLIVWYFISLLYHFCVMISEPLQFQYSGKSPYFHMGCSL